MSGRLRFWRPVAVVTGLTAATVLLGVPARPTLPLGTVDAEALTTFASRGLRLLLTVSVWYLLASAVVTALAELPAVGPLLRPVARRLTEVGVAAVVRRVVATSAAVGATVSGVAAAAAPADEPPVMVPIDPSEADDSAPERGSEPEGDSPDRPLMTRDSGETEPSSSSATRDPVADVEPPPVMNRDPIADAEPPPVMNREPTRRPGAPSGDPGDRSTAGPGSSPRSPAVGATTHVVVRGESFWSIAADLVAAQSGQESPDAAEIVPVWQRLIDRNAAILVDPGNPDLLHVGQVIDLETDD